MLYVFHGEEEGKNGLVSREQAKLFVDSLLKKRDGALSFRVTGDEWSLERIREYVHSQGLFVHKYIVVLDGVFEKKENRDEVSRILGELKTSPHVFVIVERSVDALSLKKLNEVADIVKSFNAPKKRERDTHASFKNVGKREEFSIFALADAFASRNKKEAWMLYRQAINKGLSPEEICGTLVWQIKMIMLAQHTTSSHEAGVKDFPYQKAKSYSRLFSIEEAENISRSLICAYHEAHRGHTHFESALEKSILELI